MSYQPWLYVFQLGRYGSVAKSPCADLSSFAFCSNAFALTNDSRPTNGRSAVSPYIRLTICSALLPFCSFSSGRQCGSMAELIPESVTRQVGSESIKTLDQSPECLWARNGMHSRLHNSITLKTSIVTFSKQGKTRSQHWNYQEKQQSAATQLAEDQPATGGICRNEIPIPEGHYGHCAEICSIQRSRESFRVVVHAS